jgi:hypothetical protein
MKNKITVFEITRSDFLAGCKFGTAKINADLGNAFMPGVDAVLV